MSSKVITQGDVPVSPMEWRRAPLIPPASPAGIYESRQAPDRGQPEATEQSKRELEQRTREAYQQGFREGEAAGVQHAGAQMNGRLDDAIERFARAVEELTAWKRKLRHDAESDLVELAMAIARRVLRRELTMDPEALLGLVKAGLDRIDAREIHRVRVSPEHVAAVSRHLAAAGQQIEIVADAALAHGGAVFETSRGVVDASIETQLTEIERGFADLYSK